MKRYLNFPEESGNDYDDEDACYDPMDPRDDFEDYNEDSVYEDDEGFL